MPVNDPTSVEEFFQPMSRPFESSLATRDMAGSLVGRARSVVTMMQSTGANTNHFQMSHEDMMSGLLTLNGLLTQLEAVIDHPIATRDQA